MKKLFFTIIAITSSVISYSQISANVFYVELKDIVKTPDRIIKEYPQRIHDRATKTIVVYPEITFQTIDGIGGAFNEIGGEALMSLPEQARNEVMENLFGLQKGAGFSFCRTAVGASDFGIDAYSYSEKEDDYEMKYFSIAREKNTVLPYIKLAYKFNPKLKLFASPWSPPAWMKYSGYMDRGVEFPDKNYLKDDPKIYKAYALYFSKYIKTYSENGIHIDRLILQNEQDVSTKYPSCVMPPKQMAKFAKDYLRPVFKKHKIKTEIWAGTFRTAGQLDAIKFVNNQSFRESVDGIAIQYTKPRFISDMKDLFIGVNMMHSEGKCFNGDNSVDQAKSRLAEVASYINFGSPNYCYWNMILNETGKSGWDWKQNSLINIDRKNQSVTYNPDFATMALMSRFLRPGAKRVASFSRSELISVVKDEKIILLVQNDSDKPENYECQIGENKTVVEIPANSLASIILKRK